MAFLVHFHNVRLSISQCIKILLPQEWKALYLHGVFYFLINIKRHVISMHLEIYIQTLSTTYLLKLMRLKSQIHSYINCKKNTIPDYKVDEEDISVEEHAN